MPSHWMERENGLYFNAVPPVPPVPPGKHNVGGGKRHIGGLVGALHDLAARLKASRQPVSPRLKGPAPKPPLVGADGVDMAHPGAWLLVRLWRYGATVARGADGAVTITPHPSGRRITGALLGACRRHAGALARWVGADLALPLVVMPIVLKPHAPLCPTCGTRRWWRPDSAAEWVCWKCEPPALTGVEELAGSHAANISDANLLKRPQASGN